MLDQRRLDAKTAEAPCTAFGEMLAHTEAGRLIIGRHPQEQSWTQAIGVRTSEEPAMCRLISLASPCRDSQEQSEHPDAVQAEHYPPEL
jgi:hypothetical protein